MFISSGFRRARKITFSIIIFPLIFLLMVGCNEQGNVSDTDKNDVNDKELLSEKVNDDQTSHFPLTISDSANRSVTFEERPKRIVTVIPADMEIIYALGGEVFGRPKNSSGTIKPPEVESAEDIGHPIEINFEKIAALKADLFIGHKRLNIKDVPTLESLNSNVVLTQGDSVEEIKNLIEMYGNILNEKEKAKTLINTIEKEIAEISSENKDKRPKVLILFGTPNETMSALPKSLAGNIFELAGAENISKDLPNLEAYPTYAQLSLERILEANPDAIYFMSMGESDKALKQFQSEMSLIPAWNELSAIKNDNLIILPHDLFGANPGPRIVDSLQFLKDSLNSLKY